MLVSHCERYGMDWAKTGEGVSTSIDPSGWNRNMQVRNVTRTERANPLRTAKNMAVSFVRETASSGGSEKHYPFFGSPAVRLIPDPWLCVPASRRGLLFGKGALPPRMCPPPKPLRGPHSFVFTAIFSPHPL